MWVQNKQHLSASWEFVVVSDGHLFSSGAPAHVTGIFVYLDQLPEHWIIAVWIVTCEISLPPAHPMNEDGHSEVWLRGIGPATGLQVSCSRLGSVRPSRTMGWLIQQHLWSSGRKFFHSHRGVTEAIEYSAQTSWVFCAHRSQADITSICL